MTIAYRVGDNLYLNLTNRCPCACTFCIRNNADTVYEENEPLWLEHEPSFEEVKMALQSQNIASYKEIVFCGYGEPTEALDVLVKTAAFIRANYKIPLRLNTNGLGNLINNRDITGQIAESVDTVSISLNSSDPIIYANRVRPRFGAKAFPAMLDFAKATAKLGVRVIMTTVSTTITKEDEANCTQLCKELGVTYRIRHYEKPKNNSTVPIKSPLTTLCYLEKDNCYLMLHRITKQNDVNHNKWIGVGGHFEGTESPEECLFREVKEETGYQIQKAQFRGIVTFVSDSDVEYMCLYTSSDFTGTEIPCDEGELKWVQKSEIPNLNLWEGDRIFLKLLSESVPFFSLKLVYTSGTLKSAILDGKELTLF